MGYTKLFNEILTSTIWDEKPYIKICWITILALKDERHEVMASIPGLAHAARITIEQCEESVNKFLSPDPYSRSKEFEGRRLEAIDGGWHVLNGEKYRQRRSVEERREYMRNYMQKYRSKDDPVNRDVNKCKPLLTDVKNVSPSEQNRTEHNYMRSKERDEEFERFWKAYPKKRGKEAARKAWLRLKLKSEQIPDILSAIEVQSKSEDWVKEKGQFIPYPQKWLNEGRWNDVVFDSKKQSFSDANPKYKIR